MTDFTFRLVRVGPAVLSGMLLWPLTTALSTARTAMATAQWAAVIEDARTFMELQRVLTTWADAPDSS